MGELSLWLITNPQDTLTSQDTRKGQTLLMYFMGDCMTRIYKTTEQASSTTSRGPLSSSEVTGFWYSGFTVVSRWKAVLTLSSSAGDSGVLALRLKACRRLRSGRRQLRGWTVDRIYSESCELHELCPGLVSRWCSESRASKESFHRLRDEMSSWNRVEHVWANQIKARYFPAL